MQHFVACLLLLLITCGWAAKALSEEPLPSPQAIGGTEAVEPQTRSSNRKKSARVSPRPENRIVAFGDLHGDVENALAVLHEAGVVDDQGHWVSERDTVVQVGDLVDRGPHGHTIMELFARLAVEAKADGGEFLSLIGNHELMNMKGEVTFATVEAVGAFGGVDQYKRAFDPVTGVYGRLIAAKDTLVVRNGTAFVHAGLLPSVLKRFPLGPDQLNEEMRKALRSKNWGHLLVGNDGPLWTRAPIYSAMRGDCLLVDEALAVFSAQEAALGRPPIDRIVVGHTIQLGLVQRFCGGRLVAIDICMSQYMMNCGFVGYVEIVPATGTHQTAATGGGDAAGDAATTAAPSARQTLSPRAPPLRVVYAADRGRKHALHAPQRPHLTSEATAENAVVVIAAQLNLSVRMIEPLPPSQVPTPQGGSAKKPTGGFSLLKGKSPVGNDALPPLVASESDGTSREWAGSPRRLESALTFLAVFVCVVVGIVGVVACRIWRSPHRRGGLVRRLLAATSVPRIAVGSRTA